MPIRSLYRFKQLSHYLQKIIYISLGERLNFDDHAVHGMAEAVTVLRTIHLTRC